MRRTCKHCNAPEGDHHAFELVTVPDRCNCTAEEWGPLDVYPPICNAFTVKDPSDPKPWTCSTCGHLSDCHSHPFFHDLIPER